MPILGADNRSGGGYRMIIDVTLLQMQVVQLIRKKPMTSLEIARAMGNKNRAQISAAVRFLKEDNKIDFVDDTYRPKKGAQYTVAPRLQKLIDKYDNKTVIPEIKVFEPDELTKFEVKKLHVSGLTRREIARRLSLTKSQVLWTLNSLTGVHAELSNEEPLHVDDVQYRVYKSIGKRWKNEQELERRLNIPYSMIEQIIEELAELNAVKVTKVKNAKEYERLDARLEITHKRGGLLGGN
jgi:DNA-binding CsgD family transcriptional regulator